MKTKGKGFEEALKDLENIVKELESGHLSLDESLKKFEMGTALYRSCKQALTEAEKRIAVLSENLTESAFKE